MAFSLPENSLLGLFSQQNNQFLSLFALLTRINFLVAISGHLAKEFAISGSFSKEFAISGHIDSYVSVSGQ